MQVHDYVERLAGGSVAIVGDIVLDHYVFGGVGRISPEAPVPVLQVARERFVLGAAANVAANIAALGGKACLIGVVGQDAAAHRLVDMLNGIGGVQPALISTPSHPTIVKTRYVSGQQQIVRVDREDLTAFAPSVIDSVLAEVKARIENCDCVVLSDYGKGVLTDAVIACAIETARAFKKPILVDPKRRTFESYRGVDYITPNRKELTEATGLVCTEDDEAALAAQSVIDETGAAILLTRSEKGMSLFRRGASPVHFSAEAREVFDVSGAGDTVVATFSLALATRVPLEKALRLANAAAGVVVSKLGTAVCSARELRIALAGRSSRPSVDGRMDDGIDAPASWEAAVRLRAQWEREGLKVGFANGCFDLIHPGHIRLLRQAAAACDRLIVAINSDASVQALKGPARPVQTEVARAQVLSAIKGVDLVVLFSEATPLALIEALQPDLIVKGSDYTEDQVVGASLVRARGGEVLLVDLVEGQSTSALLARV